MVEYSFEGLDEFGESLSKAIETDYPEEFRQMVINLAFDLQGLTKTKTPVDTSYLRDNWKVGEIYKRGNEYFIEVFNNAEYAEAVEYGHRQQAGRYVPALGKRLVKNFVPGAHMMELSLAEISRKLPEYLKGWIDDFIKKHNL